jgi:hypothetical protein
VSQHYSDPSRADDPRALPDVEVWYDEGAKDFTGWFYWFCFPGCLPDSEPAGPFETREAALEDARRHS